VQGCGVNSGRSPGDKQVLIVVRKQEGALADVKGANEQCEEVCRQLDAFRQLWQGSQQRANGGFRIYAALAKDRVQGFFF
jgi:hypothetical protein